MPNMGRRIASLFPWMLTGGAPAFTDWHTRYRAGFQWCGTGAAISAARRKSRELRGVQRPLAKYGDNKSLVSLYFATASADWEGFTGSQHWFYRGVGLPGSQHIFTLGERLPDSQYAFTGEEQWAGSQYIFTMGKRINRQPNTASII